MSTRPTFQGMQHGQRLTRAQGKQLLTSPDFLDTWALVPGANGNGLTLMLRSRCTSTDLDRAHRWARSATRAQPRPFSD